MSTPTLDLQETLARLRGENDDARAKAWQQAGPLGATAVAPLTDLLAYDAREVARAAHQALRRIVHHAGRPGAPSSERVAVSRALADQLAIRNQEGVRRDLVWLLSEIGGDEAVPPLTTLLEEQPLRDDARMALERIPGRKSLAALQKALASAPPDFRPNLAHALRVRGRKTSGVPDLRLTPTKSTTVQAL